MPIEKSETDEPLTPRSRGEVLTWSAISAVVFVAALTVAGLLFVSAPRIQISIFYMLLVILGLCSAGFLFGALHTHAKYTNTHHGKLEIRGPAVVFFLVILIGLVKAPPDRVARLTVYLHAPNGLLDNGKVTIRIRDYSDSAMVGLKLAAQFEAIPAQYAHGPVDVDVTVPDFTVGGFTPTEFPEDGVINVTMLPVSPSCPFSATLVYSDGSPIVGAIVRLSSDAKKEYVSDQFGDFSGEAHAKCRNTVRVVAMLNEKVVYENDEAVLPLTGEQMRLPSKLKSAP